MVDFPPEVGVLDVVGDGVEKGIVMFEVYFLVKGGYRFGFMIPILLFHFVKVFPVPVHFLYFLHSIVISEVVRVVTVPLVLFLLL